MEQPDSYYVEGSADASLRANGSEDSNGKMGSRQDKQPLVVVAGEEHAATLTSGGHPNSNEPGRRREDDLNLAVVQEPQTFDWQLSGGGADTSFRGKGRAWMEDKPGTARALTSNKTLAVHVPAPEPRPCRCGWPEADCAEGAERVSECSTYNAEPQAFDWTGDDPANTPAGTSPPLPAGHAGEIAVGFIAGSSPKTGTLGEEDEVAPTMGGSDNGSTAVPTVAKVFTKTHGAQDTEDAELWDEAGDVRSLNSMHYATDVVVEAEEERPPSQHPGAAVRRLTPRECERLQGFPDDWTLLEDATADGPRYSALGDAVTVNVPYWIVSRLVRRESVA